MIGRWASKSTWNVPCLIRNMSGFQILAWCESALKWGLLERKKAFANQQIMKFCQKQSPALLQMSKARVLPGLVEQKLDLIVLRKEQFTFRECLELLLTKLDSSGLWRERRVIPILTGIGRSTGGLSLLSYLRQLAVVFFCFNSLPGAVQEDVQDLRVHLWRLETEKETFPKFSNKPHLLL